MAAAAGDVVVEDDALPQAPVRAMLMNQKAKIDVVHENCWQEKGRCDELAGPTRTVSASVPDAFVFPIVPGALLVLSKLPPGARTMPLVCRRCCDMWGIEGNEASGAIERVLIWAWLDWKGAKTDCADPSVIALVGMHCPQPSCSNH